jgi:hypothetical protein
VKARWRVVFVSQYVSACSPGSGGDVCLYCELERERGRLLLRRRVGCLSRPATGRTEVLGNLLLEVGDCRQHAISSLLSRRTRARYRYVYTVTVCLVGSYGRYP